MKNSNKHLLEDVVTILKAERLNKKLHHQILENEKSKILGDLAAGIAHDFNNLLTIIQGYSEQFLDDKTIKKNERFAFSEIFSAAQRGVQLTSQILSYARQDLVQINLICLNDLIKESESHIERKLKKKATIDYAICKDSVYIMGNQAQIIQVLIILAANAADAIKKSGLVQIKLDTVEVTDTFLAEHSVSLKKGSYAKLSFIDNGRGISYENQARIFDLFFTTKTRENGTGLSLSVAYGILRQHKGIILCDSKLGVGTKFSLYFPVSTPNALAKNVEKQKRNLPKNHDNKKKKIDPAKFKILFVEDDLSISTLLTNWLLDANFKVTSFTQSIEAKNYIESTAEKIDLLITDIIMPHIDGVELSLDFKLMHPDSPILYITGYTDDYLIRQKVQTGQLNLLKKPFEKNEFLNTVIDFFQ